jgi:hypothetical protein
MNIHKNAPLTPLRREEMALSVIEGGFSKAHAARSFPHRDDKARFGGLFVVYLPWAHKKKPAAGGGRAAGF